MIPSLIRRIHPLGVYWALGDISSAMLSVPSFMVEPGIDNRSAKELIAEIETVRQRLDQARSRIRDGNKSTAAAATSEEIKQLCRHASISSSPPVVNECISRARRLVAELEKIIGAH